MDHTYGFLFLKVAFVVFFTLDEVLHKVSFLVSFKRGASTAQSHGKSTASRRNLF